MADSQRKHYDQRARDRRWANARSLKLRKCKIDLAKEPWERDDLPSQRLLDIVVEDCEAGRRTPGSPPIIPRRVAEGY